jgi:hypothetical protein
MQIHGKIFSELNEEDLKSLIDDKVSEGKFIEYKQALPGDSNSHKKEFLADVSSFSNTAGGYIFFGILEEDGLPQEVLGLDGIDQDAEILRLENLLRDGITPRIPGINIRAIPIGGRGPVLAIHVSRSWASPHMVSYAGGSRFYARNSAGKYPLDVFELRNAFTATSVESERIRSFRMDRIANIIARETPVPINVGPQAVLHLIPIGALASRVPYDLREFQSSEDHEMLAPIYTPRFNCFKFNFDGVLTSYQHNLNEPAVSYLQLFRNGIIESCSNTLFRPETVRPYIPSVVFEKELVCSLDKYLRIQNELEIEPPFFVLFSLLNVAGYDLQERSGNRILNYASNQIDRNNLIVPELLVEDKTLAPEAILKPAFDAIWNAAGQPQSPYYDTNGNWNTKK